MESKAPANPSAGNKAGLYMAELFGDSYATPEGSMVEAFNVALTTSSDHTPVNGATHRSASERHGGPAKPIPPPKPSWLLDRAGARIARVACAPATPPAVDVPPPTTETGDWRCRPGGTLIEALLEALELRIGDESYAEFTERRALEATQAQAEIDSKQRDTGVGTGSSASSALMPHPPRATEATRHPSLPRNLLEAIRNGAGTTLNKHVQERKAPGPSSMANLFARAYNDNKVSTTPAESPDDSGIESNWER
jgi:hypothetical protein